METLTQIGQMLGTYGVSAVIVIIFLWDYVANKKKNTENQETIKTTLEVVKESTTTISNCLIEMQQTNLNTAKSLELLQRQMENTDKKIDILLEGEECKMSNKVYDVLKWITLVFLPALTTLTGVILNTFNVNCTDIVLTIMTAATTFMGAVLGISNINYNNKSK